MNLKHNIIKILLSFSIVAFAYFTNAQVIVAGVSPSNIVGNYPNDWADPAGGWGTPNFLIPGVYIQDTLMLANDGFEGLNAQGNPVSAAACNPLLNNLNGKIAVIYRGDGTTNPTSGGCEFGLKAFNAQTAGAVGVIIINREPGVITPGAGASGATVTIPVVMLSNTDGAILVNQMQSGAVVVFIGNKTFLFANDVRLSSGAALAPKQGFVPALLAQNATEFNFSLGARIYNDGNLPQGSVSLRATVTSPAGSLVYDNSVSGMYLDINDSIDVAPGEIVNLLPDFSLATYPLGTYTLTYTASIDSLDDYASDNSISYTFTISESVYSAAKIDTATGLPSGKTFYRPSENNQTYSICTAINNPNASRLAVEGLYFAATKGTVVPEDSLMEGEEMNLILYKWEDVFADLNDPSFGFGALSEVAQAFYYYTSESQEGETVYGAFASPVVLEDNQRYLACVQTVNINLYMGHDNTNYTWNTDFYLQPISPIENDGTWSAVGFGTDVPNAVGIRVFSSSSVSPISAILSGTTTTCSGASTNLSVAVSGGVPPYTVTVTNGTNTYTAIGASPVSIPVSPTSTSTYSIVSVIGGGTGTGNTGTAIVTVIPNSTNTTAATACDSYAWNGQTYTQSGVYTGTTANCVTQSLNLTITPSSTNTTTASACNSYTWNGQTYTQSGVYTGTTANCVTESLNLTITPSSTNTTTAAACDSYAWNGTTYTTSGVYTGTTTNCVTQSLNLTITPSSANTTAATACDSYAWNGQTYTQSGVYTGATANCVTQFLNLSITPSSTITQPASQSINISNNAQFIVGTSCSNAIYQWQTDLGIGFQNLNSVGQYSGTSNNTLTVSNVTFSNNNQLFRCIVSSGSCTDTSDVAVLTVVNNVGFNDLSASKLSIYPNPTNGDFTITGLELVGTVSSLTLTDMNGKVVKVLDTKATKFSMGSIKPGVYFLNIISENKQEVLKIVKE